RSTTTRRAKPEAVLRQAQAAIVTLANEWKKTFENFANNNHPVPPVMIVVCDNTDLAEVIHADIARGHVFSELSNDNGNEVTIRIDSKLLEKAESATEPSAISNSDNSEKLRRRVATIGKQGEPGEGVRCVVSVMMLNEGWDAQ